MSTVFVDAEEPSRREPAPAPAEPPSRYEALWDEYSRIWDSDPHFRRYRFLGDEWGPDEWVSGVVENWASPYLRPESCALEIGPGGGRYTIRLAPLCAELACVDVSGEMLARVRRRLAHFGHVRCVKGNGRDLGTIADDRVDFAFSCNVFVQLGIEDVYGYLVELERVLSPGGVAAIHYASLSGDEGFRYFLEQRERWAADPCQRGRFCELTLPTMDLLVQRARLTVVRNETLGRDAMTVVRKPPDAGRRST